jgi:hypothetical protein
MTTAEDFVLDTLATSPIPLSAKMIADRKPDRFQTYAILTIITKMYKKNKMKRFKARCDEAKTVVYFYEKA